MKKLVNLKGAKAISRKQQKDIYGGNILAPPDEDGGGDGGYPDEQCINGAQCGPAFFCCQPFDNDAGVCVPQGSWCPD